MPRIFDNIESKFVDSLRDTLSISERADFCVGYFSLSGWRLVDDLVEKFSGNPNCCRLLVGMNDFPSQLIPSSKFQDEELQPIDQGTALKLKIHIAQEFRDQLERQVPTNSAEVGLRKIAKQIRENKLKVKVFLKHPLHAKLYLCFRNDAVNPRIGFLGSSNLSFSGLKGQGELNVDVMDHDSTEKLSKWFDERWNDRLCVDIGNELAELIEKSWAREELIPPYHIYLNIAYHLSKEARNGIIEFDIPREFRGKLFDFQAAAIKIAAHHLNKRGGVLLGDVVGLGKTMMATAVARIFQDDFGTETLIMCPPNLTSMWQSYVHQYRLLAHVVPISMAMRVLPDLRRYRVAIIDESHNLRNRDGKRYRMIREYLQENECKCILLSATPYNKSFSDVSAQLRLFLSEEEDLGIRPEKKINEIGEAAFNRLTQASPRSLAAFEYSEHPDDWRELMRLFMVRRTRTFIQENYAKLDKKTGKKYLTLSSGERSYFPTRIPKTVKFRTDSEKTNQYIKLFSNESLNSILTLKLPRYGLGNYSLKSVSSITEDEAKVLQALSRAGKRLIGVCRTNLFKRLESGGPAFILSLERHIIRNFVYMHAIENRLSIPIGVQSPEFFGSQNQSDQDSLLSSEDLSLGSISTNVDFQSESSLRQFAANIYGLYEREYSSHFKWIRSNLFSESLLSDLISDANALIGILHRCGKWDAKNDPKINSLFELVSQKHKNEKVLVFSQFADTVRYLKTELSARGLDNLEAVTGDSDNPAEMAWRFSPVSNGKPEISGSAAEIRVLLTTDVLSEGVNLQDGAIIVNFDLPWAIIRLVQRAGRIDRIGQKAESITCYSFLPAEGIEQILKLRSRVRNRLKENAEVIGTDEAFFEDDSNDQPIIDIYNEKAGVLDQEIDSEVDLASQAFQIWKNAIEEDPSLESIIPSIPAVCYSAKQGDRENSSGVITYVSMGDGSDLLTWIDNEGSIVTQSQSKILEVAKCEKHTPAMQRSENHHELVERGLEVSLRSGFSVGGQLGKTNGSRYRTYERIKRYIDENRSKADLFRNNDYWIKLEVCLENIYKFPLRSSANDSIKRQLKSGITDEALAAMVLALADDDLLCVKEYDHQLSEPKIICSLGLRE